MHSFAHSLFLARVSPHPPAACPTSTPPPWHRSWPRAGRPSRQGGGAGERERERERSQWRVGERRGETGSRRDPPPPTHPRGSAHRHTCTPTHRHTSTHAHKHTRTRTTHTHMSRNIAHIHPKACAHIHIHALTPSCNVHVLLRCKESTARCRLRPTHCRHEHRCQTNQGRDHAVWRAGKANGALSVCILAARGEQLSAVLQWPCTAVCNPAGLLALAAARIIAGPPMSMFSMPVSNARVLPPAVTTERNG